MVTNKLRAIWQLIRADHVMLFTQKGGEADAIGFGPTDLETMMTTALQLKISYGAMLEAATEAATLNGELHTLTALKKAMEGVKDVGE